MELAGGVEAVINTRSRLRLESDNRLGIQSLVLNSPAQGLELNLAGTLDYQDVPVLDIHRRLGRGDGRRHPRQPGSGRIGRSL
ncbi:MAG: hypothetical protein U5P41_05275 [Gammaproteobacteria bacterium]|nr:hypothetical protein [Gammaproteobacteria bacterium]